MTNRVRNTTAEVQADPMIGLATAAFPGGIEASEARGQRELVASDVLPGEVRPLRSPDGSFSVGAAKALLESWGFVFGAPVEGDPLFVHATLPPGWSRKATDHSMWSKIVDDRGRERCAIFYKAAFYDRKADMHVSARYRVDIEQDPKNVPFGRSRSLSGMKKPDMVSCPVRAHVKEGDAILFTTKWHETTEERKGYGPISDSQKEAEDWIAENYGKDLAEQWARP